ncbi:hypothetical protein KQX54_018195 [Cotesia glomerata]|uniref:Uncharacterized protein n=1 Tax=Cotesia glomerata TaxID=32391 RepID=A0AAV7HL27_COTGL|nr:hypothetical protein KQX54_018195 [Cotesia glomerata]
MYPSSSRISFVSEHGGGDPCRNVDRRGLAVSQTQMLVLLPTAVFTPNSYINPLGSIGVGCQMTRLTADRPVRGVQLIAIVCAVTSIPKTATVSTQLSHTQRHTRSISRMFGYVRGLLSVNAVRIYSENPVLKVPRVGSVVKPGERFLFYYFWEISIPWILQGHVLTRDFPFYE